MMVNPIDGRMAVLAGTTVIANGTFFCRVHAFLQSRGVHLSGRDVRVVSARNAQQCRGSRRGLGRVSFASTHTPSTAH